MKFACAALISASLAAGCQTSDSVETSASATSAAPVWNQYGEKVTYAATPVAPGALKGDETGVTISGVITEVCQHQGCWIRLVDPAHPQAGDLFVKTTGHAYLVPRNSRGRQAMAYGRCELSEMSVADQRHYAEEAGKSVEEIAMITQPRKMITFHADSISIEGTGLDKPLDQD